jgi:serine/threonine protein kinase
MTTNSFFKKGLEIGSGNFGRVVKAEAVGLKDADENVTTVAVKMVKPTAKSKDAIVALVRELKILIYLGEHLNIVNLLGACTKTSVIGENQINKKQMRILNLVFLIVEKFLVLIDYCQFGNLKSYLIKHRNQFINQLSGSGEMQPVYETAETDTIAK